MTPIKDTLIEAINERITSTSAIWNSILLVTPRLITANSFNVPQDISHTEILAEEIDRLIKHDRPRSGNQ